MLQNKEQTFLLAHRAIMFPNYVRRCLILPVPNSLTVACPFLGQYSLQWYHTGQETPENKKQTNVTGYTVWPWDVLLKNWNCSFYCEFEDVNSTTTFPIGLVIAYAHQEWRSSSFHKVDSHQSITSFAALVRHMEPRGCSEPHITQPHQQSPFFPSVLSALASVTEYKVLCP